MGAVDCARQELNVYRMKMLGAEVVPVHAGQKDAQGSRERSDARLGDERPQHALHSRHGLRRASVSGDGAKFSAHHRRRSARADFGKGKASAGFAHRVCRRRLETPSDFFIRFWPTNPCKWSAWKPADSVSDRSSTRHGFKAARSACCRARAVIFCRMRTARSNPRTASAPDWITPPSGRNTRCCTMKSAWNTPTLPTTKRLKHL